jgi:translation initiation factor IF-3
VPRLRRAPSSGFFAARQEARHWDQHRLGEVSIARPPQESAPSRDGPRINNQINVPQVRLVKEDGTMVGVVPIREALIMAEEAGLDLVEISPNASPPVCKILDFGKFKYELQKKESEARKKQKVIEVKEIKLRPGIDEHDYQVKMRSVHRFLEEGDKVKVTMRFRGREMVHQELGMKVLDRVRAELESLAKVEQMPRLEGRQMIMVMAPK